MTTATPTTVVPPPPVAPPTRDRFGRFREGLFAPLAGLTFMNRRPALWRFAVIPIVLNVFITLVILVALAALAIFFARQLHPLFDPSWTDRLLEAVTILLLILAALGGTLAAWVLLNGILCGYFHGKLAREVEIALGFPPDEIRELTFGQQAVDTLRDLLSLLKLNLGVLALNLLPGIGSVIAFPIGLYVNGTLLGKDFLDFPLALRGLRREEKWPVIRQHKAETFGLGAAVFLFQLIPILGGIVAATAVVGAVLLHRRWLDADPSTPPPRPVT